MERSKVNEVLGNLLILYPQCCQTDKPNFLGRSKFSNCCVSRQRQCHLAQPGHPWEISKIVVVIVHAVTIPFEETCSPIMSPQQHLINITWHSLPVADVFGKASFCTTLCIIEAPIIVTFGKVGFTVFWPNFYSIKAGFTQP